ncbi:ParA family protein [Vibrio sp. PNB22_3_1]
MKDQFDTLSEFELLAEKAKKLLNLRDILNPKDERTFNNNEAKLYLDSSKATVNKYAEELGFDTGRMADDPVDPKKWVLTLSEIYAIRDALPKSSNLKRTLASADEKYKPNLCQVIVIQNQKGGVGKTISTLTLASGLAVKFHEQYRVCVIDMDGQSTLSSFYPPVSSLKGVKRVTVGELMSLDPEVDGYKEKVKSAVSDTLVPNLKIIPSDQSDRDVETQFHEGVHSGAIKDPYKRLRSVIDQVRDDFDIILIDTPPSLGFSSLNAYLAASSVIFPFGASQNDTDATLQYLKFLPRIYRIMMKEGHSGYDFVSMLITNYENSISSQEVLMELSRSSLSESVLDVKFNKSEAIRVCAKQRNSLYDMSSSQYPGIKKTYQSAVLNADSLVISIMLKIKKVWAERSHG